LFNHLAGNIHQPSGNRKALRVGGKFISMIMKTRKFLFAFGLISLISLGNLFAQGISCTRESRLEFAGVTISTYTCDNGCTSTTISTVQGDGSLTPALDYTSCP
jgi:hypothetical protein